VRRDVEVAADQLTGSKHVLAEPGLELAQEAELVLELGIDFRIRLIAAGGDVDRMHR
jgi:hypothetical protein